MTNITRLNKIKGNLDHFIASSVSMMLLTAVFSSAQASTDDLLPGPLTPIIATGQWLNSPPLTSEALRGNVVLVDFWTYSCSNCLNALPYVKAWNEKYRAQGLVVIGVHTPEFPEEMNQQNIEQAIKRLGVTYPVVLDNQYKIWNAYANKFWPAQYLIDAQGQPRYQHYGEGSYQEIEFKIQELLNEAKQGMSSNKR